MLGLVIPERDGADADALSHALTSPDRDLDFESLSASVAAREGWVDWRAGHVLGGMSAGTVTGVGEYAGDGTINPSVLGGDGNCADKADEYTSSPVRRFNTDGGAQLSRPTDEEDDGEEEVVMGLLFAHAGDDDFVPPSGLGKG
jgi:hypothetical protein